MTELLNDDFPSYFREVHGHDPFPWQRRLTAQVLQDGRWPDVIDLPTGTGKTAVLDTAVFALAIQPEVFPRRVVFVIDRRIVVDQVVERAQLIQKRIQEGSAPVLRLMKGRLREIGGESLLGVVALRGGIPIDGEWARRPDEPWVIVSTVDQFGSRLLFRGYGVSPKMRPVHAGLAGNDCLIILDEVHLSRAFAQTLQEVGAYNRNGMLPRRFQVIEMSATPTNSEKRQEPFRLTGEDLAGSDELRRRAKASKSATLREAGTKQPHTVIPAEVKKILKSDLDESIRSVGVIVNRVQTARETHRALTEAGYSAHLITGRMRPLDKARSLEVISVLVDPDNRSEAEGLTVVVATQAIEVGADFSFDALITEVAPIDSLRQRFGRLDRRGTLAEQTGKPARAWIVGAKYALNPKHPDLIYGDSARATWEELQTLEGFEAIDFSPYSETPHQFPDECFAPAAQAPLLLSTYMDAWVQTNPEPVVQPAVDWFLHGIEQDPQAADVAIAWRHDRSLQALREVPLRLAEYLQVPIGAVKAWLGGAEEEVPVADVNGSSNEEIKGMDEAASSDWCRWQGHDEEPASISAREIRPGDVLIVNPARGGLAGGTWDPSSTEQVDDLGDEAQHAYGQRFTLRLDERLLSGNKWPTPPHPNDEATALEPLSERVGGWLDEIGSLPDLVDWQREAIGELKAGHEIRNLDDRYYILVSNKVDSSTLDGSDQSSSFTGTGVTLRQHLSGVGKRAADYARRLGLSDAIQSDLKLAAQLHDLGKVDSRFQQQMIGNDLVQQAMIDEPLAKSLPAARPASGKWPPVRHEIMSVAMVQSNSEVLTGAHDPDLVLHLVGTHHGFARPLPPIKKDDCPEILCFDYKGIPMEASTDLVDGPLALEMADRFWRLIERYGYHGLAWLEAILRLADIQQSAEETKQ